MGLCRGKRVEYLFNLEVKFKVSHLSWKELSSLEYLPYDSLDQYELYVKMRK